MTILSYFFRKDQSRLARLEGAKSVLLDIQKAMQTQSEEVDSSVLLGSSIASFFCSMFFLQNQFASFFLSALTGFSVDYYFSRNTVIYSQRVLHLLSEMTSLGVISEQDFSESILKLASLKLDAHTLAEISRICPSTSTQAYVFLTNNQGEINAKYPESRVLIDHQYPQAIKIALGESATLINLDIFASKIKNFIAVINLAIDYERRRTELAQPGWSKLLCR